MGWATEHLGAEAIVYPGFGAKDHARAAVQFLSGTVPERSVFTHTGWRRVAGEWVYLHAGGAIGADDAVEGVEVALPGPLAQFMLPEPPSGDALKQAIRASLGFLKVAPGPSAVPLFASAWRAGLASTDFTVHVAGPTGAGKTEVAALAQQHYGADMDARHLPAAWASTGNALEGLAFQAKDALLVVDDFAPAGSTYDVQRLHREADRFLRAQGNQAGRQRMRSDATLRPAKQPRGLTLSTGEDVPRGQSLRARVLVLEMGPDDVDWHILTRCQQDAANGLYAEALAGFLSWLAPRYGEVSGGLRAKVVALREQATQSAMHRRTPEIVANLALGLRYFLDFAEEAGAATSEEADALWKRWWRALGEAAMAQEHHQAASEPTGRFMELLSAAIVSGQAHIANMEGAHLDSPGSLGWRLVTVGTGDNMRQEWQPKGVRIGWLDGDDLYLQPDASYGVVQRLGRDTGDPLAVTPRTLRLRLHERGMLVGSEAERGTLAVRRTIEGRRMAVLHLHRESLFTPPPPGQTDQGGEAGAVGQVSGSGSEGQTDQQTDQGEGPQGSDAESEMLLRLLTWSGGLPRVPKKC